MNESDAVQLRAPANAVGELYDHALVEQCSADWRVGDWDNLVHVPLDKVEQHPQRGQLAVLVAAAHMAAGTTAQARTFLGLARQWGVEERLITRVLVAGVHNTLGRASLAAGEPHHGRAMYHFAEAVSPGAPAGSMWRATEQRARRQVEQLGLPGHFGRLAPAAGPAGAVSLPQPFRELQEALHKQDAAMRAGFKAITDDLFATRSVVRKEAANVVKQVEAFFNLQTLLRGDTDLPDLHGWPISADFGVYLLRMLHADDYDLVIEFGSGSSTLLMARTLDQVRPADHPAGRARQVALEHLAEYHAQTAGLLARGGVADRVQLLHAPLEPLVLGEETFPYYATAARDQIAPPVAPEGRRPRVLLMVDGPPGSTGPQARYPAVPYVRQLLAGCSVALILDDYGRPEEKQVAQRWMDELAAEGIAYVATEAALEKRAIVLRFELPALPAVAAA